MDQKLIESFLGNHIDEKWFEKDKELFIKQFPQSKLIPDLHNAQKYNKKHLDERICAELLMHGGVCDCTIWENRGFTINKNGFIIPLKADNEPLEEEQKLLEFDLEVEKPKYNDLKELIFALKLPTSDNKSLTYIEALKIKKAELIAKYSKPADLTPIGDQGKDDENTESGNANTNADAENANTEKVSGSDSDPEKKRDPDTNTQQ